MTWALNIIYSKNASKDYNSTGISKCNTKNLTLKEKILILCKDLDFFSPRLKTDTFWLEILLLWSTICICRVKKLKMQYIKIKYCYSFSKNFMCIYLFQKKRQKVFFIAIKINNWKGTITLKWILYSNAVVIEMLSHFSKFIENLQIFRKLWKKLTFQILFVIKFIKISFILKLGAEWSAIFKINRALFLRTEA